MTNPVLRLCVCLILSKLCYLLSKDHRLRRTSWENIAKLKQEHLRKDIIIRISLNIKFDPNQINFFNNNICFTE